MRLLVSVRSAIEASAASAGGADLIDAKDPLAGSLGAVSLDVLREIRAAVDAARPISAALGDATSEAAIERSAFAFAAAGAAFIKVGFAQVGNKRHATSLISAAVHGAHAGNDGACEVVAVAYADADRALSVDPAALVRVAARSGAAGLLLDTWDKTGPGLRSLVTPDELAAFVAEVHRSRLFAALAGKLSADDLPFVRQAGADIAGVRGAACDGGRAGRVTAERVGLLRGLCTDHQPSHPTVQSRSADHNASK